MEGFLGIKKGKEGEVKGKEIAIVEENTTSAYETEAGTEATCLVDSIDEDMFDDDDTCLEELESSASKQLSSIPETEEPKVSATEQDTNMAAPLRSPNYHKRPDWINPLHTEEPVAETHTAVDIITEVVPTLSASILQPLNPSNRSEAFTDCSGPVQLDVQTTKASELDVAKQSSGLTAPMLSATTYQAPNFPKDSPVPSRLAPFESQQMSSPDIWGDMFATSTQIYRELSQPKTPSKSFIYDASKASIPIEDVEPKSDDLFDSTNKTSNHPIDASDGVIAHDFAYFKQTSQNNIVLGDRVIPKSPTSFGSLKRKRGDRFPNVIVTASPKTTSNCHSFTDAQISFTSDLTKYGYSTQIAENMFGDESDTDEEDFSFHAQPAPKQPTEDPMLKDRVLMPPPPLRKQPQIFKPPSQEISLPEPKQGLGIGIWGVSTQDIRAVFMGDDGSDTEEDDFGPSLPLPPLKPNIQQSLNSVAPVQNSHIAPSVRLEASPILRPVSKKARLMPAPQQQSQLRRLRTAPVSAPGKGHQITSLTRSFSAPPHPTPPARMSDLHEFGISTQLLNDFAEEDVELSPTEPRRS